jgi:hypothetical protein
VVTENIETDADKQVNIQTNISNPNVVIGKDDTVETNESLTVYGRTRNKGRLTVESNSYFQTANDHDPVVFIGKPGVPASNTSLAVQGSAAITGRLKVGNVIITEADGRVRFVLNGRCVDLVVS